MKIELYNDTHFPSNSKHITNLSIDHTSCQIDKAALMEHQVISTLPTAATLFKDSYDTLPPYEVMSCDNLNVCQDPVDLAEKLFFIQYRYTGTLRRRWFLI